MKQRPAAFLLLNVDQLPEKQYLLLEEALPPFRRERAQCYRRVEDRKNCTLSYCLLRYAIQEQFGVQSIPQLYTTDLGKLYFADRTMPYFNWSHCKKGVFCAVAEQEIGCDIQDKISNSRSLWRRCLHQQEQQQMPKTDDAFTRLWTLKESCLKYAGVGLHRDMRELDFSDCMQPCGSRTWEDAVLTWGHRVGLYYSVCAEAQAEIYEIDSRTLYQALCRK